MSISSSSPSPTVSRPRLPSFTELMAGIRSSGTQAPTPDAPVNFPPLPSFTEFIAECLPFLAPSTDRYDNVQSPPSQTSPSEGRGAIRPRQLRQRASSITGVTAEEIEAHRIYTQLNREYNKLKSTTLSWHSYLEQQGFTEQQQELQTSYKRKYHQFQKQKSLNITG